jgi:membrane associated rhomboid family serine protease
MAPDDTGAEQDTRQPSGDAPDPQIQRFFERLIQQTPRVFVTPGIVAVNAALFLVMVVLGVHPISPDAESLLSWGANFGPATASGEWWRMLVAMFIHVGLIHVAMNMWVLWSVGFLVERLVGNVAFLVVYLFSGLLGFLASLWWKPFVVSAGASGSVFGVIGALIAFLALRRKVIPIEVLSNLRNGTLLFLGFNLVFGLVYKQVDMAAHLGGLLAGFVCALPLCLPLGVENRRKRWMRGLVVAGACCVFLVLGGTLVPKDLVRMQTEWDRFVKLEQELIGLYNSGLNKVQSNKITDAELARVLRRDLLPRWSAAEQRIGGLRNLPAPLAQRNRKLHRYIVLRQEGWTLLSEALLSQDRSKADRAMKKQQEAERVLKGIGGGKSRSPSKRGRQ